MFITETDSASVLYIYIYSGIDALPVNYSMYLSVRRFKSIKDTAISDHRSLR